MQHAMLNRATMRVADTTDLSGRVTAESIKHGWFAKKQSAPHVKRLFACFLLAAGAMLLSVASYGQGQAINSVPYTITQPGQYFLNKDLSTLASGAAIAINTSNVILDFNGHTLINTLGTIVKNATGVALATNNKPIENVTIKNGTIDGFQTGISLAGGEAGSSDDHVVDGMHISYFGFAGIDTGQARSCLITNNFVDGISPSSGNLGIFLHVTAGFNQVSHNRVVNCEWGIVDGLPSAVNGQNYLESNFVAGCTTGIDCINDKSRFNTTQGCTNPSAVGTDMTDLSTP
jgi:hypothetical protein